MTPRTSRTLLHPLRSSMGLIAYRRSASRTDGLINDDDNRTDRPTVHLSQQVYVICVNPRDLSPWFGRVSAVDLARNLKLLDTIAVAQDCRDLAFNGTLVIVAQGNRLFANARIAPFDLLGNLCRISIRPAPELGLAFGLGLLLQVRAALFQDTQQGKRLTPGELDVGQVHCFDGKRNLSHA